MVMKSSYEENFYGPLLTGIVKFYKPRTIVEFGILDGYSLYHLIEGVANRDVSVTSYDLFEDYPFRSSSFEKMRRNFGSIVQKGNFFDRHLEMKDNSIDLMHIDISNTGDIYSYAFRYYMPKLSPNGIMLLEGGSEERDQCNWMIKYNKDLIRPVLMRCPYPYFTFLPFPSLTMIQKVTI
jgi:predicted O-methyltransferase YrrM